MSAVNPTDIIIDWARSAFELDILGEYWRGTRQQNQFKLPAKCTRYCSQLLRGCSWRVCTHPPLTYHERKSSCELVPADGPTMCPSVHCPPLVSFCVACGSLGSSCWPLLNAAHRTWPAPNAEWTDWCSSQELETGQGHTCSSYDTIWSLYFKVLGRTSRQRASNVNVVVVHSIGQHWHVVEDVVVHPVLPMAKTNTQ